MNDRRVPVLVLLLLSSLFLHPGCNCSSGPDCPAGDGAGDLTLDITAPPGLVADVVVTAPDGSIMKLTGSDTLAGVADGEWAVAANNLRGPDPIVDEVWYGTVSEETTCVAAGGEALVSVEYALAPGSNKLWVLDDLGAQLLGVGGDDLSTSGSPTPAVEIDGAWTSPRRMAIEASGTLWVSDGTGSIHGYDPLVLGTSGAGEAIRTLTGSDVGSPDALAFDAAGALWVCDMSGNRISRFDPAALRDGGDAVATLTISGPDVDAPRGLAFDAAGNLWVASAASSSVVMFSASRLGSSVDTAADIVIVGETEPPVIATLDEPRGLAFDAGGNLWVGYWSSNIVARYTPAELALSATLTPAVQIAVSVAALVESIAFDNTGALWVTYEMGEVAAYSPAQLGASGSPVPDVVLSLSSLQYPVSLAFYAAPAWSPLVSGFPSP